jgi:hypothetical protein
MQLFGWAASRATEAVVDRVADRAARAAKARLAAGTRNLFSEKRQFLSGRANR